MIEFPSNRKVHYSAKATSAGPARAILDTLDETSSMVSVSYPPQADGSATL